MKEEMKYLTIKNLVDNKGNKKRAALKLECSLRTINRLIRLYNEEGKYGFVHKNRGRLPASTFDQDTKAMIIDLYISHYGDTNLTHFCEILLEDKGISISDSTLHKWLKQEFVLSPKARRKTKKDMKAIIRQKQEGTSCQELKVALEEAAYIIDSDQAHPRRPRCQYFGEMIQMDASSYSWVSNEIWHLHVAIDDSSGHIVGAYFDTQETLRGYYNVFFQILNNYGIPAMFYTDRRTVFEYKRKNTLLDNDDTFTQFAYACHQLGVEIKTTSVAQAKGRVERLNQTLQSRLPVELRRHNIHNIEEANQFLASYLQKLNEQFSLPLNHNKSVFESQPTNEEVNQILAVISPRKVQGGHCIKFMNKYYIPNDKNGTRIHFRPKVDCLMIEAFDGTLYLSIENEVYFAEEIQDYEEISRGFSHYNKNNKEKKKQYKPSMTHPWKHASYMKFLAKQSHRNTNAYI